MKKVLNLNRFVSLEDVALFEKCNRRNLITCKYNHFIIRHETFTSEIHPDLYYWPDEDTTLRKTVPTEVSQKIIQAKFKDPGQVIKANINHSDSEWTKYMVSTDTGKYSLVVFLKWDMLKSDLYADIRKVGKTFEEHYIILDRRFCEKHKLINRQRFGQIVVSHCYEPNATWEVITTHQCWTVRQSVPHTEGQRKSEKNSSIVRAQHWLCVTCLWVICRGGIDQFCG